MILTLCLATACVNKLIPETELKELNIASLKTEASLLSEITKQYGKNKLGISNQQLNQARAKAALLDGSIDIFIGDLKESPDLSSEIIAKDPLVIVTNLANKINNLNRSDLQKIFAREVNSWKSWTGKDQPILVVDQDLTNPDYIALYSKLFETRLIPEPVRVVTGAEEARVAVSKFDNAISYLSFRDLDETIKTINIDNLPASKTNIDEGYYPLFRDVKLYYNPSKIKLAKKKRSLKKFRSYIYSRGQDIVIANNYMPVTAAERELIKVDSDPVYIGIAVPLDGPYLELAKSIVNAAKLAVEDINENDGINSRPVELIVCNDKASVAIAIECANKFVANEVQGVIGHLTSQTSIEASKIYAEHNIVQISPASTHPWFTERPGASGYVYRTIARDDKQAELMVALLDQLGLEAPIKVSVFNNGTIYGSTLATLIENVIIKQGKHKLIEIKALEQAASQYHKEIEALKSQVLIFIGEYGDAAQIVKELALNAKQDIKFIGADGVFSPGFIKEAGLRAEGAFVTGSSLGDDPSLTNEFVNRFENTYKVTASAFAMNSYDATNILIEAIEASIANNTSLKEQMHKTKHVGITGKISFNELGDPNEERMCIYRVTSGKFVKQ
ncbi:MAG: ABC transporter substrate-binding protein [Cyanobacteria bacterium]|nr:ABC transporter substrate-binding protein [Cyanobacteriota bacterium]